MSDDIRSIFQDTDDVKLMTMEDALSSKMKWGDYVHPLIMLRNIRSTFKKKGYGDSWANWDPIVLFKYCTMEFGELRPVVKQKILALTTALASDAPWYLFDVFENSALAFTNQIPIWGELEPLDIHEVAFACGILDAIRDEEYSSDVRGYIAACFIRNGVICHPSDSPVVNVNDILMPMLEDDAKIMASQFLTAWSRGKRAGKSEVDPLSVQLDKFQTIEEWYNAGHYIPEI